MSATPTTDLLGALGLDARPAAPELALDEIPPRRDRRHQHGPPYADEELLDRIVRWERIYGAPPTKTDWDAPKLRKMLERALGKVSQLTERIQRYESGDWPAEVTVRDRFGSVNDARPRCGYPAVPPGRPARSATPDLRPKAGESALRGYFRDVAQARGAGDALALKAALYTLAMSAIREADRIDGGGS